MCRQRCSPMNSLRYRYAWWDCSLLAHLYACALVLPRAVSPQGLTWCKHRCSTATLCEDAGRTISLGLYWSMPVKKKVGTKERGKKESITWRRLRVWWLTAKGLCEGGKYTYEERAWCAEWTVEYGCLLSVDLKLRSPPRYHERLSLWYHKGLLRNHMHGIRFWVNYQLSVSYLWAWNCHD